MPLRYKFGVDARVAYTLDDSVDFAKTVRDYTARGKQSAYRDQGALNDQPAAEPARDAVVQESL